MFLLIHLNKYDEYNDSVFIEKERCKSFKFPGNAKLDVTYSQTQKRGYPKAPLYFANHITF